MTLTCRGTNSAEHLRQSSSDKFLIYYSKYNSKQLFSLWGSAKGRHSAISSLFATLANEQLLQVLFLVDLLVYQFSRNLI